MSGVSDRLLILFSGGADSVMLLELAMEWRRKVTLLTFNYGQVCSGELECLPRLRGRYESVIVDVLTRDITSVFSLIPSNLLRGGSASYPGVHEMHLPGRNLVFVAVALVVAEAIGIEEVWIGCDYSDRVNGFPDCTQEWVVAIDALAKINGHRPISVKAPLLGMGKAEILAWLSSRGVPREAIFSGYGL